MFGGGEIGCLAKLLSRGVSAYDSLTASGVCRDEPERYAWLSHGVKVAGLVESLLLLDWCLRFIKLEFVLGFYDKCPDWG